MTRLVRSAFVLCSVFFALGYTESIVFPISQELQDSSDTPDIVLSVVYPEVSASKTVQNILPQLSGLFTDVLNYSESSKYQKVKLQTATFGITASPLLSWEKQSKASDYVVHLPIDSTKTPVRELFVNELVKSVQQQSDALTLKSHPFHIVVILTEAGTVFQPQKDDACLSPENFYVVTHDETQDLQYLQSFLASALSKLGYDSYDITNPHHQKLVGTHPFLCKPKDVCLDAEAIELEIPPPLNAPPLDVAPVIYWVHPWLFAGTYSDYFNSVVCLEEPRAKFLKFLETYKNRVQIFLANYDIVGKALLHRVVDLSQLSDVTPEQLRELFATRTRRKLMPDNILDQAQTILSDHVKAHTASRAKFVGLIGPTQQTSWVPHPNDYWKAYGEYAQHFDGCIKVFDYIRGIPDNVPLLPCQELILTPDNSKKAGMLLLDEARKMVGKYYASVEHDIVRSGIAQQIFTKEKVDIDLYLILPDVACLKGIDRIDLLLLASQVGRFTSKFAPVLNAQVGVGYGTYKSIEDTQYYFETHLPNVHQKIGGPPKPLPFTTNKCGKNNDGGLLEFLRVSLHPDAVGFAPTSKKFLILFYDDIYTDDTPWLVGSNVLFLFENQLAKAQKQGINVIVVVSPQIAAKPFYNKHLTSPSSFNVVTYDKTQDNLFDLLSHAVVEILQLQNAINLQV